MEYFDVLYRLQQLKRSYEYAYYANDFLELQNIEYEICFLLNIDI